MLHEAVAADTDPVEPGDPEAAVPDPAAPADPLGAGAGEVADPEAAERLGTADPPQLAIASAAAESAIPRLTPVTLGDSYP